MSTLQIERYGKNPKVSIDGIRLKSSGDNYYEVDRQTLAGVSIKSSHNDISFEICEHTAVHKMGGGFEHCYLTKLSDAVVEAHIVMECHQPCWDKMVPAKKYLEAAREIVKKLQGTMSNITELAPLENNEGYWFFSFDVGFRGMTFGDIISAVDDLERNITPLLAKFDAEIGKAIDMEISNL